MEESRALDKENNGAEIEDDDTAKKDEISEASSLPSGMKKVQSDKMMKSSPALK